MDETINLGFQDVAEKILLNLPFKDLMAFRLVNKSSKEIWDNPKFWIKYWLKGLSKKNKADWIKAIHLTKNTNLSKILLLYIKGCRDRIVDMPCYINEKIVEKFSHFTDENSFQEYLGQAFGEGDSIRSDAGSIQICMALVKRPNAENLFDINFGFVREINNAITNDRGDIVQVMAPFIGNANAKTPGYLSPIQWAIRKSHTISMKFLAPFCDDYLKDGRIGPIGFTDGITNGGTLIHFAVWHENAEAIKIIAPFIKNPNAPSAKGITPIQLAVCLSRKNPGVFRMDEIIGILQDFVK